MSRRVLKKNASLLYWLQACEWVGSRRNHNAPGLKVENNL